MLEQFPENGWLSYADLRLSLWWNLILSSSSSRQTRSPVEPSLVCHARKRLRVKAPIMKHPHAHKQTPVRAEFHGLSTKRPQRRRRACRDGLQQNLFSTLLSPFNTGTEPASGKLHTYFFVKGRWGEDFKKLRLWVQKHNHVLRRPLMDLDDTQWCICFL